MQRASLLLATVVLLSVTDARNARAQFSPGPLSGAHAGLEGAAQCAKCHDRERGVAPDRCLTCHTALADRIRSGQGLHARADYAACATCHIEHHGRDFQLVFWGKQGRAAFDHASTGFTLEGGHARLSCEGCHQARRIQDRARLAAGGVNLARTFLGLATSCRSCHADPHGGQFGRRECASCHGQQAWRPLSGFDHGRTRFALTGRHAQAACASCHTVPRASSAPRRFAGVAHASCASCHRDPHDGRLGADCAGCHSTEAWSRVDRGAVDHDRTGFPLRGRHRQVDCGECHRAGAPLRSGRRHCSDCHADRHLGQFARRGERGRCEACHDVEGFSPARFSVEDHRTTRFPLTGAHLAVPCDACHREAPPARIRAAGVAGAPASGPATEQFRFASTRCQACHADPHGGDADRFMATDGCASCHQTARWSEVSFDHARTRFPLAGKHASLACASCHARASAGGAQRRLRLAGLGRHCGACHADPHRGQFAALAGGAAACERCHEAAGWDRIRFDHDRETAFPLQGAHRQVTCARCHKPEVVDGAVVVRYRGLGSSCQDCHGASQPPTH